jgi:hypothetical protein
MNKQVAIVAHIRSGKREQLALMLADGPPFALGTHGFTRHHVFLGDETVVFIFEGTAALEHVHDLGQTLSLKDLARMGLLIHEPQVLTKSFEWLATDASPAPES